MSTEKSWFHKKGELARDKWQSVVDATTPGWEYTGIRIAELVDDESVTLDDLGVERIFIPLAGSFTVAHNDEITTLQGRKSVFDGPTDVLYLPTNTAATLSGTGRVAVAEAPTTEVKEWKYIPPADTPVELRGAGRSSRQVHNFGTPEALDAARLIVCEVITPGENWSSYPPHKHDEYKPGHESKLEEIYYFESALTRAERARFSGSEDASEGAFGMFSTYSSPAGDIDINAMVYTGDIALVPYGYHGPAVAAPGYDLYYLNVMAGPDPERIWLINDDPAHAWVRETWDGQEFDTRLPYEQQEG
ncbi:5-deoxy-glucuronate isomerase [Corynebacterium ammoniagenes]|uniref:5-deoxy-glucuronate isomerase n=2 Tax=Corynebacterium ammoniagenes TaxID=1697 RepID=A0AAV5G8M1_CORAM|nr:5-deoxy-glucuronate isomerase [Corynebacterium ammoniagenes]APT82025.1 5-deoxyglucuronate isomerase [Corynebacterium ammoniagenes DSM 20306]AQS73137.1 5-deoxy-glucuronate isomerase [Corynebacterium ammoniagenes]EFG80435.1 myo-inositol catabolism protein IolB [Corynebacterium ammoniagenes DSM 20306]NMF31804.1 5-deoxy-glucuronate isomerase [Corynebacterium ammoniagenes]GJN41836.1 5-deoxy-glucuronate isomerase [Corynebacterium ammoniagenes]